MVYSILPSLLKLEPPWESFSCEPLTPVSLGFCGDRPWPDPGLEFGFVFAPLPTPCVPIPDNWLLPYDPVLWYYNPASFNSFFCFISSALRASYLSYSSDFSILSMTYCCGRKPLSARSMSIYLSSTGMGFLSLRILISLSLFRFLGSVILLTFAFYWKSSLNMIWSIVGLFSGFFCRQSFIIKLNSFLTCSGIVMYFCVSTFCSSSPISSASYGYF